MEFITALGIVLELAEGNVIDDPDMQDETDQQETAIKIVYTLMDELQTGMVVYRGDLK